MRKTPEILGRMLPSAVLGLDSASSGFAQEGDSWALAIVPWGLHGLSLDRPANNSSDSVLRSVL